MNGKNGNSANHCEGAPAIARMTGIPDLRFAQSMYSSLQSLLKGFGWGLECDGVLRISNDVSPDQRRHIEEEINCIWLMMPIWRDGLQLKVPEDCYLGSRHFIREGRE